MGDGLRSAIRMEWWCHCLNLCTTFCVCCPGCSKDKEVSLMFPLLQLICSHATTRPVSRWSSGVFSALFPTHHPKRFIIQGLRYQLPDLNFVWLSSQALLFLISSNHCPFHILFLLISVCYFCYAQNPVMSKHTLYIKPRICC